MDKLISVIIPCYKCANTIVELKIQLVKILEKLTHEFEIIFINDGSPNEDWRIIKELARDDNRIVGLNLSRNFGQHPAISAGLAYCTGDWIIVMDGDLQDKPSEIKRLYDKALEGYDVVVGIRANRQDNFFIKLTSKLFYIIFNFLNENKLNYKIANFGIYSKKVIDNIRKLKEVDRSFGLLVSLVGFLRYEIEIEHAERLHGKSSYSFISRTRMAINHILSHSNKPIICSIQLGFLMSSISLFIGLIQISKTVLYSYAIGNWSILFLCLFFLSGLLLFFMGIIGLYIGKIYTEVRNRPLYIVSDVINREII